MGAYHKLADIFDVVNAQSARTVASLRNGLSSWQNVVGRLESDYPNAVDLPTARADDQDGASSRHCVEIC